MPAPQRLPASLRYFKARLRSFGSPQVWIPVLGLALIGVFFWEYHTNPEWLEGYIEESPGPGQSELGESLSPEEQSVIAEIDNLEVLSNEFLENSADVSQPILTLSSETASDRSLTGQEQDPGNASPPDAPIAASSRFFSNLQDPSLTRLSPVQGSAAAPSSTSSQSSPFLFSLGLTNSSGGSTSQARSGEATTSVSALQQALDQQLLSNSQVSGPSSGSSPNTGLAASDASSQSTASQGSSGELPTTSPAASSSLPQPLPIPTSFIRTTPEMSPPPGTTGYTVPPVLNLAPITTPTGNAYTNLVTPQAPSNFGLPQASPLGSVQPNSLPPVTPPNNNFPSGSALNPSFGYDPTAPAPPRPFSASRGSIGGGQINTFSNP